MTKKTLGYVLLPQVAPRMGRLLGSGFGMIAFLIAQIFSSVQLLPRNHAYLNAANSGRYGIRHSVHEAWRHLRFDWQHVDQIVIFFVILCGLAILALQVVMVMVGLFTMTSAMAVTLPAYFDTMFITPNPTDDIAFIMLDRVFGVQEFFHSCVSEGAPCFDGTQYNPQGIIVDPYYPSPFHIAFHQMLSVYSYGLLVVAAIIILYFVVTVIGETAQTGTPFGQRFNKVWAPLRLVIALGLLIPIDTTMASGLNSAQYIVLYAAKFGSGFATNGWNMFLTGAGLPDNDSTILGSADTLVGTPKAPSPNNILSFATSLGACIETQKFLFKRDIKGYLVNPSGMSAATSRRDLDSDPSYQEALTFENYGDIYFVFGEYHEKHSGYPAYIRPYCGEMILEVTDVADAYSPGSTSILTDWYNMIVFMMWADAVADSAIWGAGSMGLIGTEAARKHLAGYPGHDTTIEIAQSDYLENIRAGYVEYIQERLEAGVDAQRTAPSWSDLDDFGWAGAGLWYNKVAEMNGMLISAVNALPSVRKYPETMEAVRKERDKYDQDATGPDRFMPKRADGTEIKFDDPSKYEEAKVLYAAFKVWGDESGAQQPTGNIFTDAIMAVFGTEGLYNMAENSDIHPLAQLVSVGKSLVDSSIRNLGAAFFAGVAGGIANILGYHKNTHLAEMVSSIAGKIGMMCLTAGFLLFYIVPFLPFLYFFFAAGTWVKTVLEAMVGVPLWALAHLRIDGDGLPGAAALGGYYLIFDVFLRPICIIFALLASITIFAAQVKVLHEIWPLVTSNMTGFEADPVTTPPPTGLGGIDWFRGKVDQFMFTVMYTFVVYLMALASFKLIDLVPDHIMRWFASSIPKSFGAIAKDDAEGLSVKMLIGVGAASKQAMQAGEYLGNAAKSVNPGKPGGR